MKPLRLAMALGVLGLSLGARPAGAQSASTERAPAALTRSRALVLATPVDLEYPNFVSDLNGALMSSELVGQLDAIVNARLGVIRAQYGFNSINSGFYALQRDGLTRRPYGVTYEEELAIRKEMAHTVKRYVIFRGLPKFFASRSETKPLAQAYESAMGLTRVQFTSAPDPVTKRVWTYSAGVDPFKLLLWTKADNGAWSVEGSKPVRDLQNFSLRGARRWRVTTVDTVFVYPETRLGHTVGYVFNPRLTGAMGISYSVSPVAATRMASDTVKTVTMSYSF